MRYYDMTKNEIISYISNKVIIQGFQVFESPASFTLPRDTIPISGFADLISWNC